MWLYRIVGFCLYLWFFVLCEIPETDVLELYVYNFPVCITNWCSVFLWDTYTIKKIDVILFCICRKYLGQTYSVEDIVFW